MQQQRETRRFSASIAVPIYVHICSRMQKSRYRHIDITRDYYTRTANRSDPTCQHAYNRERIASFLNNALAVNAFQTQHHYFNQHHYHHHRIVSSIDSPFFLFFLSVSLSLSLAYPSLLFISLYHCHCHSFFFVAWLFYFPRFFSHARFSNRTEARPEFEYVERLVWNVIK